MKALVDAFNQEKALDSSLAFSVIVQFRRLIVCSSNLNPPSGPLHHATDLAPSHTTLDLTEEATATGLSTTMPASLYSEPEPALYNTDTEDYDSVYGDFEVGSAGTPMMDCILLYTTQDCASESDSLLGHNKAKSAPNIATATTTAAAATSTAKQMPSSGHNFQLKMLDETLSIGVNQVTIF